MKRILGLGSPWFCIKTFRGNLEDWTEMSFWFRMDKLEDSKGHFTNKEGKMAVSYYSTMCPLSLFLTPPTPD